MQKRKISQEEAKALASKVFVEGKGVRPVKTVMEYYSGIAIDRKIEYLDGDLYFNLGPFDRAYAAFGFELEHTKYKDMWAECGKYTLSVGSFPFSPYGQWKDSNKRFFFKAEADLVNCLKAIAEGEYSGDSEQDKATIYKLISKYAFAFCNSKGYSQRI